MQTETAKTAYYYIVRPNPEPHGDAEFYDMSDALEFAHHVGGQAFVIFTDLSEQVIA
jgi:hypothetical protein